MKKKAIKLSFNKEFFAKLLGIKKDALRYVFLVYKNDEDTIRKPAISVKGITEWVYDIEISKFIRLSTNHSTEKMQVKKTKDEVIFSNSEETQHMQLTDFYRRYMTKVVNVCLY